MEHLNTSDLFDLFNSLSLSQQAAVKYGSADVPQDLRDTFRKGLRIDRERCRRLGLHFSAVHIDHILEQLNREHLTFDEFGRAAGNELLRRILDELSLITFLRVLPDRAPYYREPFTGWEAVLKKFPSARFDVEEAGKCFAVNRYTASVFHAMRILEIGLVALGRHYKVSTDRTNWQMIIDQIEKKVRSLGPSDGAKWKDEQQFGSEACTEFRHFKDAWRNHVIHIRQTFDDERAHTIYDHVRTFMVHLATRLKEQR